MTEPDATVVIAHEPAEGEPAREPESAPVDLIHHERIQRLEAEQRQLTERLAAAEGRAESSEAAKRQLEERIARLDERIAALSSRPEASPAEPEAAALVIEPPPPPPEPEPVAVPPEPEPRRLRFRLHPGSRR